MYGTIARLKVKPGMEQEVTAFADRWERERKRRVDGAIGGYIYKLDGGPGAYIMAVAFRDKESYHANAQSPEQDADYQRLRALLTEDPIWEDGEIIGTL